MYSTHFYQYKQCTLSLKIKLPIIRDRVDIIIMSMPKHPPTSCNSTIHNIFTLNKEIASKNILGDIFKSSFKGLWIGFIIK